MTSNRTTVKIEGTEEITQALNRIGDQAKDIIEQAVRAGAGIIREDAGRRAPKRTGKLAGSMVAEVQEGTSNKTVFHIGPDKKAFYGRFVEMGTCKMPARPFLVPALKGKEAEVKRSVVEEIKRGLRL